MNSKQKRKERRDERFRGIEHCVDNPYSHEMMNDFCPNIYLCRNAEFEFKCFGRYESCKRYKTDNLKLPVNGYDR